MIGIITDTDIVQRAVAEKLDQTKVAVEKIMTTPLATIESTRSLRDAHDMMADLSIRHLPVSQAGKVVGLLSVRDLLVCFASYSEPRIGQD